ncbi:hypothetical protein [Robiginitalea aurantiaca]|uniref:CHRD domain-containing protein n=1 Tax=Robiginitalea aurantiaca TaxID=3056915 RepID=A0ABT7WC89_9FLAO|nr:hypothetical protein [Robiginitalea aurantiaca]MDM9630537.1 hypothetical protein [Robiginitalea aurantiaca]
MKKYSLYLTLFLAVLLVACSDDDADLNVAINPDNGGPISEIPSDPERVDYELFSVNDSGVSGIAAFIPNDDGSATVYIELENATQDIHPARIHFGSIEESGSVAISLNDCECKISETVVTRLDNGAAITFVQLMQFDGHLNINMSSSDNTVVANTNIGANAF